MLTATGSADSCEEGIFSMATPVAQVSAYCRAVVKTLIPSEFWGNSQHHISNLRHVMHNIDHFIRSSRFETMTLHTVVQGVKVSPVLIMFSHKCS